MMNTIKVTAENVRMIAHRGMSGLERENTAAAFVAAGNRSHYGIETDVRLTADGKFVLCHDSTTTRVAGEEHIVSETVFDELRKLHLKDKNREGTRGDLIFATPEEYFSICKKYEKQAILEIKGMMTREQLADLLAMIRSWGWLEHTTFIAFEIENLILLSELYSELEAQYLVKRIEDPDALIATLKKYRFALDANHSTMTPALVQACHAEGLEVNVWTVDDPARAAELIEMGVDYITSNILEGQA